jgi:hypothetical protein
MPSICESYEEKTRKSIGEEEKLGSIAVREEGKIIPRLPLSFLSLLAIILIPKPFLTFQE